MSSTITALFDSRADAEAGKDRLKAANIDVDHINIHDKNSAGYSETAYSTHEDQGLWASIKNAFLPDEDRHTYEEGVRRGGVLLTADVDDDDVPRAVKLLEESSVDIDDRSKQWKAAGWKAPNAGAGRPAMPATAKATTGGEQVIPIVEEQLIVGKRDVERGGVRVRSYVTETPVHEQVRLRNERVAVERRPVDRAVSDVGADAFQERTINVKAMGEEAVIGKTARVVEEVVVKKTAEERVENVTDTVRKTNVEVDGDKSINTNDTTRR